MFSDLYNQSFNFDITLFEVNKIISMRYGSNTKLWQYIVDYLPKLVKFMEILAT